MFSVAHGALGVSRQWLMAYPDYRVAVGCPAARRYLQCTCALTRGTVWTHGGNDRYVAGPQGGMSESGGAQHVGVAIRLREAEVCRKRTRMLSPSRRTAGPSVASRIPAAVSAVVVLPAPLTPVSQDNLASSHFHRLIAYRTGDGMFYVPAT
jgi:hypothetical protein